ncbi:MAG: hypothetical protein IGS50_13265 [Synechococcales cyanobacterium C42_A2020_086]|jgi:hypothetical protein|nr:hypothetical protein [Synechococcales cyanobacterium C42_A2020_086]
MTLTSKHRSKIAGRIKLPQPDLKNITALSDGLPDTPILPWNHYDSWLDTEAQIHGHSNGYTNGHAPAVGNTSAQPTSEGAESENTESGDPEFDDSECSEFTEETEIAAPALEDAA